jgi:flagellar hook-basal body complex protein FliE
VTAAIGGVSGLTSALSALGGTSATTGTSALAGATGVTGTAGTQPAAGGDFASILSTSLDQLQATQSNADSLASQAATGDLTDVSDYMIASNEASLATETVVALKNQAVGAFNEIMRMQV